MKLYDCRNIPRYCKSKKILCAIYERRLLSTGCEKKNAVFVAGTMQHHGKTTITLGLVHALLSRNVRLAYQKPVGQQTVSVECDGRILQVDRDVDVFKHMWPSLVGTYSDCSPVTFPPAFTRYVLDGKETPDALRERCVSSFRRLQQQAEYVVVEGTGHIGVGSIVGLNNAQVSATSAPHTVTASLLVSAAESTASSRVSPAGTIPGTTRFRARHLETPAAAPPRRRSRPSCRRSRQRARCAAEHGRTDLTLVQSAPRAPGHRA